MTKPNEPLIMICEGGFYPIESVEGIPLEKQAEDHGKLNSHIIRIDDMSGKVLWSRVQ